MADLFGMKIAHTVFGLILLLAAQTSAQTFTIVNAGELELGGNTIKTPGLVTDYFGMNVEGLGKGKIRVSSGDQAVIKDYEFKVFSSRLFSYFFHNNLSELANIFRRGVTGTIGVEILEADGTASAGTSLTLNILLPRKNCRASKTRKALVPCEQADLAKLTKKQRALFVKSFTQSIKGPIVLEP